MIRRPGLPAVRDRGAVILSLAVLFPVVLTAVMLVVQASLWWYADQVALTALREGVDAGRVRGRRRTTGTPGCGSSWPASAGSPNSRA
ncbi:hypothetical protein GCM10025734_66320 [Kitasatospora paranensis]|uniref:TadE family protein n=1 Tax=Kitasatospora paranensis TaxID=258053 RepID=UPI0031EBCDAB